MGLKGRIPTVRIAGWAAAACLLWSLAGLASLRTEVEITSDGSRVRFMVAGTTVEVPAFVRVVERLAIVATDSSERPGGRSIQVLRDGKPLLEDPLPYRFDLPRGKVAPLGDWFTDRNVRPHEVYEREVELSGDFTVRASITGRSLGWLTVRLEGHPTLAFRLRRGLINNDLAIEDRHGTTLVQRSILPRPAERGLAAAATLLRTLAAACVLIAVGLLVAAVGARHAPVAGGEGDHPRSAPIAAWVAPVLLGTAAAGLSAWTAGAVLEGTPHVPDEVTYLLQASWLLSGRLTQEMPLIWEHLQVPFTVFLGDRWIAQYPVVWPALLALGVAVRLPWLVAPLLGGLYTALLVLLGRELYGRRVGWVAGILSLVSPMATLMFASQMSHALGATLVVLFLWLHAKGRRRSSLPLAVASGAVLGLAFGVRPLTALALAAPVGLVLASDVVRCRPRARPLLVLGCVVAGGLAGTVPTLVANLAVTGDPLTFPYQLVYHGVYGAANLPHGLANLDALLASTLPALYGWGWPLRLDWLFLPLALAFAWLPFLLRRARGGDLLLAGCFAAVVAVHLGSAWNGLHGYGPRYYFEAFSCLYLLTARGFAELARLPAGPRSGPAPSTRAAAAFAVTLFVALNLVAAATMPRRLGLYRTYNYLDGTLMRAVREMGIDRGLILIDTTYWFDWARAAPLLGSGPEADLAVAARLDDNSALHAFYGDRPAYLWNRGRLVPYDLAADQPFPEH